MEYYQHYRSWMYDRTFPGRRGLKPHFVEGVHEFISWAWGQQVYQNEGGIRCPCLKCACSYINSDPNEVKKHLEKVGFMLDYWVWIYNGEQFQNFGAGVNAQASSSGINVDDNEQFNMMNDMVDDALGVELSYNDDVEDEQGEQPLNEEAQRFYQLLSECNVPLFEGCTQSNLSMCARLLAHKAGYGVADKGVDEITKMLLDVTPFKDDFPATYYDVERLVMKLRLKVDKIDCCINGCMLFYDTEFGKNDGALKGCKFCDSPRYRLTKSGRVPNKSMFYLPIIPRLQRLFASMKTASHMTCHHSNKIPGVMRHPSDGEAWKHFDEVYPDFAADSRNVRLLLCSDGFTPYIQALAKPYSCWPIIVTPYNLPLEMCMTKSYMYLACVVPGTDNPKAGIDVFLEPLIDDLKRLWIRELTYDISTKRNFLMRASLMWTIYDFPAYGMLSGWSIHEKYTGVY